MDFEEYAQANWKRLEGQTREFVEDAFKAGQQSKQAEIDAMKAKIDELEKWAEFHIEDYNLSESKSEHDRGWFNAACQVFKKLKEKNNDT